MLPLRRLASAWKRHGRWGFVRLVGRNIVYSGRRVLAGAWARCGGDALSDFDQIYGTDTEGIREVGSLDVALSENAGHAVRYQASPYQLAAEAIRGLVLDHSRFSFLDFGAGKGRVLLIAGELPFQAVIGIEFSQELCQIAKENIVRAAPARRAAARIECMHVDVTAYDVPDTPLVCYFYNPFDEVIMRSVVERLARSLNENPREMYAIYLHPEHRALFDDSGCWSVVKENESLVVYRSRRENRGTP